MLPRRRDGRRDKTDSTPERDAPDGQPTSWIQLLDGVVGDKSRTNDLISIIAVCGSIAICLCCTFLYACLVLTRGLHGLTRLELAPGGLICGPSIIYWTIRLVATRVKRRGGAPTAPPAGQDVQG
jgi:hypothetical protein